MSDRSMNDCEWRCLQYLAGMAPEAGHYCDDRTLQSLESKYLIESVISQWLPLEMARKDYRLTSAGRALLSGRST